MGNNKKCLVVGLQDTGKSSYMAAFWAIEKEGKSGHQLTFDKYPDNTQYLDAIGNNWLEQEPVNRSSNISQELEFSLKNKDGSVIELAIPDFKGERYKLILQNEIPSEIENWLKESDRILFFLPPTNELVFNEEMNVEANQSVEKKPAPTFNVDELEPWIQNLELLKYIFEEKGDIKIGFCVSKWDINIAKNVSVQRWIEQEHLFFYTYVRHHFSNSHVKFFGVSAQGLNYDKRGELTEAKVSELTDQGMRAYISSGTDKDYDITKPLAWLLED